MFANIVLVGRLGKDPELRFTKEGLAVCNFSMAVESWEKGGNVTDWYRVSVFGQQAEAANTYLKKGSLVLVVANRIKVNVYTHRDTQEPAASLEVVANRIQFLESSHQEAKESEDHNDYGQVDDIPF